MKRYNFFQDFLFLSRVVEVGRIIYYPYLPIQYKFNLNSLNSIQIYQWNPMTLNYNHKNLKIFLKYFWKDLKNPNEKDAKKNCNLCWKLDRKSKRINRVKIYFLKNESKSKIIKIKRHSLKLLKIILKINTNKRRS